ncbi:hypothetical protein H9P43_006562 [Blastocladiella emersonii ATCC 22665]|nr:hypothetical protein H9P43_006562 [Blastocladiella emersonii ATCC 22665]
MQSQKNRPQSTPRVPLYPLAQPARAHAFGSGGLATPVVSPTPHAALFARKASDDLLDGPGTAPAPRLHQATMQASFLVMPPSNRTTPSNSQLPVSSTQHQQLSPPSASQAGGTPEADRARQTLYDLNFKAVVLTAVRHKRLTVPARPSDRALKDQMVHAYPLVRKVDGDGDGGALDLSPEDRVMLRSLLRRSVDAIMELSVSLYAGPNKDLSTRLTTRPPRTVLEQALGVKTSHWDWGSQLDDQIDEYLTECIALGNGGDGFRLANGLRTVNAPAFVPPALVRDGDALKFFPLDQLALTDPFPVAASRGSRTSDAAAAPPAPAPASSQAQTQPRRAKDILISIPLTQRSVPLPLPAPPQLRSSTIESSSTDDSSSSTSAQHAESDEEAAYAEEMDADAEMAVDAGVGQAAAVEEVGELDANLEMEAPPRSSPHKRPHTPAEVDVHLAPAAAGDADHVAKRPRPDSRASARAAALAAEETRPRSASSSPALPSAFHSPAPARDTSSRATTPSGLSAAHTATAARVWSALGRDPRVLPHIKDCVKAGLQDGWSLDEIVAFTRVMAGIE